jgi:hypothetical protein
LYEIDFCLTSVILARNVAHASLPDAPLCWVHSSVGGKRRKTRRRKQTIKAAARRSISSFSDECKSSECPPDHDHVVSSPRMLHIGHGSCTSSVQYSSVSTSIIGTRRQIRSLDNDLPRLGEVERFSKVFAAARGRIEIKLPANFGEKLTSAIL